MEAIRTAENTKTYNPIRRGWCLGEKGFRKELLEQMTERVGLNHTREEVRESEEQHANGIVRREMKIRKCVLTPFADFLGTFPETEFPLSFRHKNTRISPPPSSRFSPFNFLPFLSLSSLDGKHLPSLYRSL